MDAETPAGRGKGAGRIVAFFLDGQLAPMVLVFSLILGAAALLTTPREEEPQIVVPMADVFVSAPELDAAEVEQLVATPLERYLWQIDGVEHVYSISRRGEAVVTVRFFVGEDREEAMIRLQARIAAHFDQVPPGVANWIVKPVEIDDVAVVTLALASDALGPRELRVVGEEVLARLEALPDLSKTEIVGGPRREIVIEPDAAAMSARGVTLDGLRRTFQASLADRTAGSFEREGKNLAVVVGRRPKDAREVGETVVAVHAGAPVTLAEVAKVVDQASDATDLVRFRLGPAAAKHPYEILAPLPAAAAGEDGVPAVVLGLAKKKGTNAVLVAEAVTARLRELVRDGVIPAGVGAAVTRDLGATSDHKVSELIEALWVAIATVVGLIALMLGWKEGFIVAVAIPVTFAITLFANQLFGYTINRVTLFALILSLGLVVDDPIVDVENIARHLRRSGIDRRKAVLDAVNEVRPPIILATLAVMVSFLPMFFITGMMGPYMAPMALNVPLAMASSMLVAFTITPWMSNRLLRAAPETHLRENFVLRGYRALIGSLLVGRARGTLLLVFVALLFFGSLVFPLLGWVPLKMLPFDNKDEFQVLVDLPSGTSLSATDAFVRRLEARLVREPEVAAVQSCVGVPSPFDFNGLVRHTYLRRSAELADLRIVLAPKAARRTSTHHLVLRLRKDLEALAKEGGATLKVLETPPGPPVVATVTVEVRGGPGTPVAALEGAAANLARRLARERGVVDVDVTTDEPTERLRLLVNEKKAALHGIDEGTVAAVAAAAHSGAMLGTLDVERSRTPVPILVRLPRAERSGEAEILALPIAGRDAIPVRLSEIGALAREPVTPAIYHKDLERVVYVFAEMAGRAPAEAIFAVQGDPAEAAPPDGVRYAWAGEGEWQITVDVFRDLGLAFAAALVMIYLLLVGQLKGFGLPLVVMASIPLTMIGIFPGFALLNLFADGKVGGFGDPTFFTATAMIGMIALAGIVVRNAIILVEFVHEELKLGTPLKDALVAAGAVRLRPVLMTAGTTLLGAWPITLDPIFSGLAWSLIFGLFASTVFTLVVIPVAYWKIYGAKPAA